MKGHVDSVRCLATVRVLVLKTLRLIFGLVFNQINITSGANWCVEPMAQTDRSAKDIFIVLSLTYFEVREY